MKTKKTKKELAAWMVDQCNDCGRDTFFTNDKRGAISVKDAFKKFIRMQKWELVSIVRDYSVEGEAFALN
jgi:hypothetical protein